MKSIRLASLLSAFVLGFLSLDSIAQQLKVPAPSPLQTIDQAFALSNIKIEYSRPSMKGRIIYGDLVPFDKVWRTGANASTKITFGSDVQIEGKPLAAGTYALYTVPGKESWNILFYKDLTLGGNVNEYKNEQEALRVSVKPVALSHNVETFTIQLADMKSNSATLELQWAQTSVPVRITTDVDATIMKNIEAALSPDDRRPYFQAASYYYENDKDLAQALTWVNKAVDQNPDAFWVKHLKAKILMKQKDYKAAVTAAEASMEQARAAGNDDYVKLNEKLIAEAKKK